MRKSGQTRMAAHPASGVVITYTDDDHSYIDDAGHRYESVTTFIERHFPKFNAPSVARKIAKKRGKMPAALLAEWEIEGERGRREGTHIHAYADALIRGGDVFPAPKSVREAAIFRQVARAVVALLKRFEYVASEKIVFNRDRLLAGTIDLVMRDRTTGETVLFDWKQNKKIRMDNQWGQKALPPIDHLDDCEFNKYSLQLSLYHWILVDGWIEKQRLRAGIIHLMEDSYRVIPVADMRDELTRMIVF